MNAQEQALFNAGVKGELRSAGIIHDSTGDAKAEDYATIFINQWLKDPERENTFQDKGVVENLVSFKSWLATNPTVEVGSAITPVNITVTMTLPVGKDGANLQLSLSAIPSGDLQAAYIEAYDELVEAMSGFRAKRFSGGIANGSNGAGNAPSPSTERIHISMVRVESKNGKNYYRAVGGRWTKYGVPVWKEVWEAAGIDPARYSGGDNPVNFDAELALGADGKPEKVTRIIPV